MSNKKSRPLPSWLRGVGVYIASIVAIVVAVFGVFSVAFAGHIYPRVSVANVVVGGLTPANAKQKLAAELANQTLKSVIATDGAGHSFTIKPEEVGASYDLDQSVASAMAVGRTADWLISLSQKLTTPLFGFDLPAKVKIDPERFNTAIVQISDKVTIDNQNADLKIKNGVVSVTPSAVGQSIDIEPFKSQVLAALGSEQTEPISLKIKKKEPVITEAMVAPIKQLAEIILSDRFVLTDKDQTYTATPAIIGGWLQTKVVNALFKPKLELVINQSAVGKYIDSIADKIDLEPQNARVAIVNGQVTITQPSKDGRKMKREVAKAELLRLLAIRQEGVLPSDGPSPGNQVALEVEVRKPDVTSENISSIGLKERVAVATTDFKTSPPNRQENIRLGAKLFNGIILRPGEQFSAIKALGRIDESSGFKPELVIKEDQLKPEIGGGLCQVSTTLFRSVMNAGLQIDERKNHRFRVGYYETRPATVDPEDYVTQHAKTLVGMDATIYDPSPDFKFTNDTGNFILIQGHVEETTLTFELYGTKDGRQTHIEGPTILSTAPAPREILYIDDPTLPTGTTKVKEKAHGAAKTTFTYSVSKGGKEIHRNVFSSSYTSWQAKSFRGTGPAAPVESPSPDPNATPTPSPTDVPMPTPSPSPSA